MANLIYKITNSINDKVYIGQTTRSLTRRKAEHRNRLIAGKRDHKLYLAMRKHGLSNFKFEVICHAIKEEFLDELEIMFIKEFNSYNRGYNSSEGGNSTSPQTRAKLSRIFKGRKITWRDKIIASRKANPNLNPKEWAKVGEQNALFRKYKVRTPSGDEIIFSGLRQFCRDNNLSHNLLLATLTGKQSHHKGYILLERFND